MYTLTFAGTYTAVFRSKHGCMQCLQTLSGYTSAMSYTGHRVDTVPLSLALPVVLWEAGPKTAPEWRSERDSGNSGRAPGQRIN